jgi:hypothetical protein
MIKNTYTPPTYAKHVSWELATFHPSILRNKCSTIYVDLLLSLVTITKEIQAIEKKREKKEKRRKKEKMSWTH